MHGFLHATVRLTFPVLTEPLVSPSARHDSRFSSVTSRGIKPSQIHSHFCRKTGIENLPNSLDFSNRRLCDSFVYPEKYECFCMINFTRKS